MSVSTANLKASGSCSERGESRLHLVYAAHQTLEDKLCTLVAFSAAARKHHEDAVSACEGFSPWTGLMESAAKCVNAASRCLRLFSPSRTIRQYKGMPALAKLYGTGAAPHERVLAFLSHIGEAFGGVLPVEIVLSGGYCLQRLDASAADDFLVRCLGDWIALEEAAGEFAHTFWGRLHDCFSKQNEMKTLKLYFRDVLLLQIECAAQSGHREHVLAAYDWQALNSALSPATREELEKYEATCWLDAARLREREDTATVPSTSEVPASTSLTFSPLRRDQKREQYKAAEVYRDGVANPPSLGVRNWRWGAVRMGILILLAVLLRFAARPLARALKSALQVKRVAPQRQRILTL